MHLPSEKQLSSLLWVLIFAAAIVRLTSIYFEIFRGSGPPTWDVDRWMEGKAPLPFATRVLVPWIVLGADQIVPDGLRASVESGALRLPIQAVPPRVPYQVLALIVLLCYSGYTLVMRNLVRTMYYASELQTNLITLSSLLLMPVMFRYHNYLYDPATLLLSTLLWLLASRARWSWLFVVFVLACLNKETALIFVLTLALWRISREGVRPVLPYLAALVVTGVALRAGVAFLSAGAHGSMVEFHLFDHNLPRLLMYLDAIDLASLLFLGLLLFSFWNDKPLLLRLGVLHLSVLVALAVFSAYVDEYRQYLDCYPVMVLMMGYSLMRIGGVTLQPRELSRLVGDAGGRG
jgi:hypothetical protein